MPIQLGHGKSSELLNVFSLPNEDGVIGAAEVIAISDAFNALTSLPSTKNLRVPDLCFESFKLETLILVGSPENCLINLPSINFPMVQMFASKTPWSMPTRANLRHSEMISTGRT